MCKHMNNERIEFPEKDMVNIWFLSFSFLIMRNAMNNMIATGTNCQTSGIIWREKKRRNDRLRKRYWLP